LRRAAVLLATIAILAGGAVPAGATQSFVHLTPDSSGRYRPTLGVNGTLTVLADIDSITPPALSPSSDRVAFSGVVDDGSLGQYAIYIVDTDGSGLSQLTTGAHAEFDPSWSPDGGEIVISQNPNASILASNCCRIAIVDVGSGQLTPVTGTIGALRPEFSPDGSIIVYDTPAGVSTVPVGGGAATLIAAAGFDATVSPDGSRVAYLFRGGGVTEIRTVATIGGTSTTVYTTANHIEGPMWVEGRIRFLEFAGLGYDGRKSPTLRSVPSSGGTASVLRSFGAIKVIGVSPGGDNDELFFYRDDGLFQYHDIATDGSLGDTILEGSGFTPGWTSIASIDLDGDGYDEMFFYRDDGLFRYYNVRPDGSLPAPMLAGSGYTTGWDSISAVDLDGDGQDEMFFYREDGLFRYYHVKADGTLPSPMLAGSGYTTGWDSITAVNLDGDLQDEIFFYREDGLFRFYNIAANGAVGSPIASGSNFPQNWTHIAVVDIEGDGIDELLFYRDNGNFQLHRVEYPGELAGMVDSGSNYPDDLSVITPINLFPS
jgi:hypothetical protein